MLKHVLDLDDKPSSHDTVIGAVVDVKHALCSLGHLLHLEAVLFLYDVSEQTGNRLDVVEDKRCTHVFQGHPVVHLLSHDSQMSLPHVVL